VSPGALDVLSTNIPLYTQAGCKTGRRQVTDPVRDQLKWWNVGPILCLVSCDHDTGLYTIH